MEILPGIHMIRGTVGGRPLQLYLLRGDERVVLLDTSRAPDPEGVIFSYLRQIGLTPQRVDLVINTHADLDHCAALVPHFSAVKLPGVGRFAQK